MMVHEEASLTGRAHEQIAARAWIARLDPPLPGAAEGPLAGLRFAVKDNIDVAGLPTTAACPAFALRAATPRARGAAPARCRREPCVGKTNLDQFACGLVGTRSPYGAVPNSFDAALRVAAARAPARPTWSPRGQVDFALGTDTAGSGRVPAGLNNIVGLKPIARADQRARRGAGVRRASTACRSSRCTVGDGRAGAAGGDGLRCRRTRTRAARAGAAAAARALPLRRAARSASSSATPLAAGLRATRSRSCRRWAARRVAIDYAPLARRRPRCSTTGPLVAERHAACASFFDAHDDEVDRAGARHHRPRGRGYSAADFVAASTQLRALGQRAARDVGRHRRADGADRADALHDRRDAAPSRSRSTAAWATYTNFVNLLDYAALAVPAALRRRRPAVRRHA